eukprot:Skav236247  [mRNA]  locus=scaffold829:357235:364183:+ [translate_table: standard]
MVQQKDHVARAHSPKHLANLLAGMQWSRRQGNYPQSSHLAPSRHLTWNPPMASRLGLGVADCMAPCRKLKLAQCGAAVVEASTGRHDAGPVEAPHASSAALLVLPVSPVILPLMVLMVQVQASGSHG